MQDDRISIELRLPGVKVLEVKEEEHWIEVVGQYREPEADCPRCGRPTWQVHQWSFRGRTAEAGRQALAEADLAGAVEAALSLSALPQGFHRAGPGLRTGKADNSKVAGDGGGLGE